MRKLIFRLNPIFLLLLFLACTNSKEQAKNQDSELSTPPSAITVAAAANLRDVLQDLKMLYVRTYADKSVDLTFGSSGRLTQQVLNGAPFDLFLSADTLFPEKLKAAGKIRGEIHVYAYGKVALWSRKRDVSAGLAVLKDSSIKKIAIANPQLAPYGKNTVAALRKAGYYEKIEKKIVWAENINQSAQFAASGNADIAFIALSNAMRKEMRSSGKYYELTAAECPAIAQSAVVLASKNEEAAAHFFAFIRSQEAVVIWQKHGYSPSTAQEH